MQGEQDPFDNARSEDEIDLIYCSELHKAILLQAPLAIHQTEQRAIRAHERLANQPQEKPE